MIACDLDERYSVYVGADNVLTVTPYADVSTQDQMDLAGVVEVVVCVDGTEYSSDTYAAALSWDDVYVYLRLGLLPGLTVGEHDVRLIVKDADHMNGLVLADDLPINVIGAC
jgi:hypothetical protein